MSELGVFISSGMKPHQQTVRQLIGDMLSGIKARQYGLKAWVYEDDAVAANIPIRDVYLDGLRQSALYIGVLWNTIGEWTLDEFHCAQIWQIKRLLFVEEMTGDRSPALTAFLSGLRDDEAVSFVNTDDLLQKMRERVQSWLVEYASQNSSDSCAVLLAAPAAPESPIPDTTKSAFESIWAGLTSGQHVLMTGENGAGKTRLAQAVADRWQQASLGKVLWWQAGNADPGTAWRALMAPLQSDSAATVSGASLQMDFRRLLRENHVSLVVLNDAWNAHAVVSQILQAVPRSVVVLAGANERLAGFHMVEFSKGA
jgi:hypothetical protein